MFMLMHISLSQGSVATSINQTTKESSFSIPKSQEMKKLIFLGNYELLEIHDVFGKVVHTEFNNTKSMI